MFGLNVFVREKEIDEWLEERQRHKKYHEEHREELKEK